MWACPEGYGVSEFTHAVSHNPDDPEPAAPAASPAAPGNPVGVPAAKAALRATVLAARRGYATPGADRALLATLLPLVAAGAPVAGYAPLAGEPGGPDLPRRLAAAAGPGGLLLPVLRADRDLDWARYDGALVPGPRGLSQPAGPVLGVAAVAGAGLVVVPAVAVDRHGVRLGRGGGSYDRALARVPPAVLVVALLYDGELLDTVPAEQHDKRVGAVITPSGGLVRLPRPAGP